MIEIRKNNSPPSSSIDKTLGNFSIDSYKESIRTKKKERMIEINFDQQQIIISNWAEGILVDQMSATKCNQNSVMF